MQAIRPNNDEFAQLLMDRIYQAGEKSMIVFEPQEFRLRGADGRAGVLSLQNAYGEYCAGDADSREQIVRHWVRHWFVYLREIPEDFADAKPDLLPLVRSRAQFDLASLQEEVESGHPASWPFQVLGEHFGIGLVYNLPDSMVSIPQAKLDAWGVTFYEAMEAARENLAALPANFVGPPSGEGFHLSATGDSYDATRLVLTDLIRQFEVKGETIAMIPNRERLVVVGSDDTIGLPVALAIATEAFQQPRPISGIALRLDGDQWAPWLPDVSHPLCKDFQALFLQTLGQEYALQKDLLEKLYEKQGKEICVATFSAREAPDGTALSYAVWTAGIDMLLPITDVLAIGRFGQPSRMVRWQTVMDVAGYLLEPLDIYPPLFRVSEFPSESQLAAMGNMLE